MKCFVFLLVIIVEASADKAMLYTGISGTDMMHFLDAIFQTMNPVLPRLTARSELSVEKHNEKRGGSSCVKEQGRRMGLMFVCRSLNLAIITSPDVGSINARDCPSEENLGEQR